MIIFAGYKLKVLDKLNFDLKTALGQKSKGRKSYYNGNWHRGEDSEADDAEVSLVSFHVKKFSKQWPRQKQKQWAGWGKKKKIKRDGQNPCGLESRAKSHYHVTETSLAWTQDNLAKAWLRETEAEIEIWTGLIVQVIVCRSSLRQGAAPERHTHAQQGCDKCKWVPSLVLV